MHIAEHENIDQQLPGHHHAAVVLGLHCPRDAVVNGLPHVHRGVGKRPARACASGGRAPIQRVVITLSTPRIEGTNRNCPLN